LCQLLSRDHFYDLGESLAFLYLLIGNLFRESTHSYASLFGLQQSIFQDLVFAHHIGEEKGFEGGEEVVHFALPYARLP
jgi:hypothetical protein